MAGHGSMGQESYSTKGTTRQYRTSTSLFKEDIDHAWISFLDVKNPLSARTQVLRSEARWQNTRRQILSEHHRRVGFTNAYSQ